MEITYEKVIESLNLMIDKQYQGYTKDIERLIEKINVDIDNIAILAQIPPLIEKDELPP
ncbi:hypothetical protein [Virgibacillus tibetensis]